LTARPQNQASVDSTIKTAAWIGPACGIASAVLYTLTNIALRNCVDVDAYLVAAVKATPTAIALGPVVGWMTLRNNAQNRKRAAIDTSPTTLATDRPRPANHRRVVQFIAASFLAQFFGNAAFQKALERIGLAASVPITLGVLIVGGAILGAVLLKEPVSRNKVIAMVTLIIAVIVLSLPSRPGPSDSRLGTTSVTSETTPNNDQAGSADQRAIDVVFGSLWAALSGLAYSFFGVTMRQSLQTGIRSSTLMLISGLTGIVTLWPYCLATLGSGALLAISGSQWATMAAAGILNFSAFIAITAALKLLPVVAVNLINASQVAMAAIAGVILFGEPITAPLGIGIFLTFIGLMVLARRTRATIVITD
jgi:drug/metabolite transporter (DMT)-like permease